MKHWAIIAALMLAVVTAEGCRQRHSSFNHEPVIIFQNNSIHSNDGTFKIIRMRDGQDKNLLDVLWLCDWIMCIRDVRDTLILSLTNPRNPSIFLTTGTDSQLVYITIDSSCIALFDALPNKTLRNLWGIRLRNLSKEYATRILKKIDAAHTFVRLELQDNPVCRSIGYLAITGQPAFYDSRKTLRCLLYAGDTLNLTDFADFPRLQYLNISFHALLCSSQTFSGCDGVRSLSMYTGPECDLTAFSQLHHVQEITMMGQQRWDNLSIAFSNKPALRRLIMYNDSLSDFNFIAQLPVLSDLQIEKSRLVDLSPLARATRLSSVSITDSPIKKLPKHVAPSLKKMTVINHHLSTADIVRFMAANPHCESSFSWQSSYEHAVAQTDRILVRYRDPQTHSSFVIHDSMSISAFAHVFVFDESNSGYSCLCIGNPFIEFYHRDSLLAQFTFHGKNGIDWRNGPWHGNAALTPASGKKINAWFKQHGLAELP